MKKIDLIPKDTKVKTEEFLINKDEDGCSCFGCDNDLSIKKSQLGQSNIGGDTQENEFDEKRKTKLLIIFGISLTIPLIIIETFFHQEGQTNTTIIDFILIGLATPVQFILGKPFYKRFFNSLKRKRGFTVDTLVVLSTSVAYAYSIISMILGQEVRFFEASTSVLTIFTIGEYTENRVLGKTNESIKKLLALKPKTTTVIRSDGREEIVDIDKVVVGDIFIVKAGENIATDGKVVEGESSVDESMITGESTPIDKAIGDEVIGGTINKNGYLKIRATGVGSQTVLAKIIEMIERARVSKPSIQRLTDRAAKYFIPVVFSIAIISSLYWLLAVNASIQFAVTVFATILVVSCPCALGIATPMVVSLGIGKAATEGVLIKGGKYLEQLASVDTVVFDKTGTLTNGKPKVTDIIPINNYNERDILQIAYSAEIKSEHPIAQAIVNEAREKSIHPLEVTEFNTIAGKGIVAMFEQQHIFVGSPRLVNNHLLYKKNREENDTTNNVENNHDNKTKDIESKIFDLESKGKTVVIVSVEEKVIGLIAVADTIRDNALQIVKQIQKMGKHVILVTGDNKRTANTIAKKLGIKDVLAEVLPEKKLEKIMELQQKEHRKVAMIGDGINDAPALTQADVGIAMGSGTDVAMASGHVIIIRNDLSGITYAFNLGQYSLRKIKQNLAISFAYNSITIPIAAGILYGITNSLILTPALAALGWIISDSLVFGNSLLLRRSRV